MKKGGRITGHLNKGRGRPVDPTLSMLRRVKSSREPRNIRGELRKQPHYGRPPPVTLAGPQQEDE